MNAKPARQHHYVPQFYMRNFSVDGKVYAFDTRRRKLLHTTPRNIGGKRDLYKLEGGEPHLAEEMFGHIESAVTPIIAKIISAEALPTETSDDFVSLLSFLAILVGRHPGQLSNIEQFTKTVMQRAVEIFADVIPPEGKRLIDGQTVTRQQAQEAVTALQEGRIEMHVPVDHSLSTSLSTVDRLTETLMQRNWILAIADNNEFVTTSKPVLLVWDELSLHRKHPAGFGLLNTTVYFPISPKLMMIGKFNPMKTQCILDREAVAAINGLHGIFSPELLIAQKKIATIQLFGNLVQFEALEQEFQNLKGSNLEGV